MKVFVASKFLVSPMDAMFTLLAFIFVKELQVTPFQLTLLVAAKPIVGLLSFYGNLFIRGAPQRLKPFIISLNVLGSLPCLFFPLTNNVWFFLASYALFIMSVRATVPAWAELLKINLPAEGQAKTFSLGSAVNYLITIFFPLLASTWLDRSPHLWKGIFFILACIQICNIILLCCIRLKSYAVSSDPFPQYRFTSLKSLVIGPWSNFWALMRNRTDFRRYQILFVLGGMGLVAMQPALPIFLNDALHLSYTQLTLATHFCKGIFFALSSPLWARLIHQVSIYKFNYYVNICSCIFILFLLFSSFNEYSIYIAYSIYGIMQSGSELSMNLSGTLFAKNADSTIFTGSNLAVIGMRGCICPFLGQVLLLAGFSNVFIFALFTCVVGLIYAVMLDAKLRKRAKIT